MNTVMEIRRAANILANAKRVVASCGAGISAESGIATFRDPGGVWETLNPAQVGTAGGLMNTLTSAPQKLIPFFIELLETFKKAEPNPAHLALGELERMGILTTVITQNIDNLHIEAGNTNVIEVHGNGFRIRCISCGSVERMERKKLITETLKKVKKMTEFTLESVAALLPMCRNCLSPTRPDVVMFGEMVMDIPQAFSAADKCDVLLAIGTSGVVYPAAYLPFNAKKAGAKVIVINPNENPFFEVSDVYIPMKAGEAMGEILKDIKGTL
jgi:NAD-dependent deacetylase